MNLHQLNELKSIFDKYGIKPGDEIDFNKHCALTEEVRLTYGDKALAYALDLFMPFGEPVEPGYEDSCSQYLFDIESWEVLFEDAKVNQ